MSRHIRSRAGKEDGATLVIFAFLLVALVTMIALVIDLSVLRSDRKSNKNSTDHAAAAGIQAIQHPDGSPRPWAGVCEAYRYVKENGGLSFDPGNEQWQTQTGTPKTNPCSDAALLNTPCIAGDLSTYAHFVGVDDRRTVEIKSGYKLPDTSWGDDPSDPDPGAAAREGCDQLAVFVTETQPRGFSAVIGDDDFTTRVRSVARVTIGTNNEAAIALLLLERTACKAIDLQGSSGAKVFVEGRAERPGIIHADSDGSTCKNNENIFHVGGASDTVIKAGAAPDGAPPADGIIGSYALFLNESFPQATAGQPMVLAEPDKDPTPHALVGRARVDLRYGTSARAHASEAHTRVNWTQTQAENNGFTYVNGCSPTPVELAAAKVFVDCGKFNANGEVFTGDEVIFTGDIAISTGKTLSFPDVRKLYVEGKKSSGVAVNGNLLVNHNDEVDCAARQSDIVANSATAKFVVVNGPVTAQGGGFLRWCGTTLILADNNEKPPNTGTRNPDCPIPDPALQPGLAPWDNNCKGYISVAGGATLDWSAPNVTDQRPNDAQLANFEDLALWTETAKNNSIGGSGGTTPVILVGVYFTPNADAFNIAGNGNWNIREAQFVSRRLSVSGNGVLEMSPDPRNIVPFDFFGDDFLVR